MKKINKLIPIILSVSMLASVSSISANASLGCFAPLDNLTRVDRKGYTDKYELKEKNILFSYYLEDTPKPDNAINHHWDEMSSYNLPEYVVYKEWYDADNKLVCEWQDICFLFLNYVLDTEEKYNEMSAYLKENYPDLELIKICDAMDDDKRFESVLFCHEPDAYSLKNVDDYLATDAEEMFEIAKQIQEDLGYDLIFVENQSTSASVKYGDANFDEELTVADLVAYASYVGNAESNPLCDFAILLGDVHNRGDGITANDALMIQQYLAGMIDSLE